MPSRTWNCHLTLALNIRSRPAGVTYLVAGHAEEDRAAERFFEEGAGLFEGELFERQVLDQGNGDDEPAFFAGGGQLVNALAARFVEGVGHAEDGRQLGDGHPFVAVERAVAFVCRLRRGPAVIASDHRRQEQLLAAHPE